MNGITTYQNVATQLSISSKDVQRNAGTEPGKRGSKDAEKPNGQPRGDEVEISREGQLRAEALPLMKKLGELSDTRAAKVQALIEKNERGELVTEDAVAKGIRQMLIFGTFAE